ncbi:hypothetical protein [[Pseudomonas] boreopolis]|uniref:hypothetical protein n=1 Tax=Xanthomonas boreopolis TaxID=86183 RepID=UPI003D9B8350
MDSHDHFHADGWVLAPSFHRRPREGGQRFSAAERLIVQGRCFAFGFGPWVIKKAKAFAFGELP